MRLCICGKGGSGKTTITILLAQVLRNRNFDVYIIDIDESNRLLPKMLGLKEYPKPLISYLGGRKKLSEYMKQKSDVDLIQAISKAKEGIDLNQIPREYIGISSEGIKLITIGKISEYSEGCACPLNYLSKVVLKNLIIPKNSFILIDTDAGIEHVGRGVEEVCDGILTIVSPEAEAIEIAKIMYNIANQLNKKFWIIINKVQEIYKDIIINMIKNLNVEKIYTVSFDEKIFLSCLKGEPLRSEKAVKDLEFFVNELLKT